MAFRTPFPGTTSSTSTSSKFRTTFPTTEAKEITPQATEAPLLMFNKEFMPSPVAPVAPKTTIGKIKDFFSGFAPSAKEFVGFGGVAKLPGQFDTAVQPLVEKTFNTPTGKAVATNVGEGTTDIVPKLWYAAKSLGSDKSFFDAYTGYYSNYKSKQEVNSKDDKLVTRMAKSAFNSAPQSALGVALSFIPGAGKPLSTTYWAAISADEQIKSEGKVTSLNKIGIDVIGDRMLGDAMEGMFRTTQSTLLKTLQGAGIEGTTEVAQTLLKYQNDYTAAKTDEERKAVLAKAKNYFTSGDIAVEFGAGALAGGAISGAGSALGSNISSANQTVNIAEQSSVPEPPTGPDGGAFRTPFPVQDAPVSPQNAPGEAIVANVDTSTPRTPVDASLDKEFATTKLVEEARKYKTAEEFVMAQKTGAVPGALQKNIDTAKAKGLTTQQFIDSNIPSRGGKLFTLPPDEMSVLQKQIGVDFSKPVAYNENKILKYLADAYEGKSLAKTANVDGLKLPATEAEKAKVIQFMRNKLDNKYSGGSVLPDTAQYERIRTLTPAELEREFKTEFKVASPNHYFQEAQPTTKSQLTSLWEQAQKGIRTTPEIKTAKVVDTGKLAQYDEQLSVVKEAYDNMRLFLGKFEKYATKDGLPEPGSRLTEKQLKMSEQDLRKSNEQAWFRRFGDNLDYSQLEQFGVTDYESLRTAFDKYTDAKKQYIKLKSERASVAKGDRQPTGKGIEQLNKELLAISSEDAPFRDSVEPPKPKATETFKSRVLERLQSEYPDLEGEANAERIRLQENLDAAVDLVIKDKQLAFDIAMGRVQDPNVLQTSASIALFEKALEEGNMELAGQLAVRRSLDQTRRGQELVAERGSVSDNSISKYVKLLIASRLDNLGKRYTFDVKGKKLSQKGKAQEILKAETNKLENKIKTKKLTNKEAFALLDKLACLS